MKKSALLLSQILIIALFVLVQTYSTKAQFREGAWGLIAGLALPSGVTLSAGIPTSALNNVTFTYSAASSMAMVLTPNLQLEAGIGYLTASFQVPSGSTASPSQSLFSLYLGGKYFMTAKEMVMPYLGLGFSFTSLPTVKSGASTEFSGSLMTVTGFFGAQSFLNKERTVSLFIQMGVGYNKGTATTKTSSSSFDNGQTNINLGGSAFGGSIYF